MITTETRAESYSTLNKTIRYAQIKQLLKNVYPDGLTCRELANYLGYDERNYTAPRCTELVEKGELEVIGKRYDAKTNRNVAVYRIREEMR